MDNSSSSSSSSSPSSSSTDYDVDEPWTRRIAETNIAKLQQAQYKEKLKDCQKQGRFLIAELITARGLLRVHNGKPMKRELRVLPIKSQPGRFERPFPGKAPFNIFPMEVWCGIFDKLSSPQDFDNCSHASLEFRKILLPKLTDYHFEQVFPILVKSGFLQNGIFHRLLKLRQICRASKKVVDTFLENHPCHYHLNDFCTRASNMYTSSSTLVDCYLPNLHYTFSSSDELRHFSTLTDQLDGNSSLFHGRTLRLNDSPMILVDDFLLFWEEAIALLQKVGKDIWHLELNSFNIWYRCILRRVLELVPNLKVLKITFRMRPANLRRIMRPQPPNMPPLSKLEVLKFKVCDDHLGIVRKLMEVYSHVKKLGIEYDYDRYLRRSYDGYVYKELNRPNLEVLSIPQLYDTREVVQLRKLISSYSSLQTVSLDISDHPESYNIHAILAHLQIKHGMLLKTLNLNVVNPTSFQFPVLQFPALENLMINGGSCIGLKSIDFLLQLKSLKNLTIIGVDLGNSGGFPSLYYDSKSVCLINFLGWEQHLYESNVWKLLPNLEQVLFKDGSKSGGWLTRSYQRSGYEKYWNEKV